jgi:hypothetical protein
MNDDLPRFKTAHLALLLAVTIHFGCSRSPLPFTSTCSVVGFDQRSSQYTLIYKHLIEGKPITKRLVVRCASYAWGDREVLTGPAACKLAPGRTLKENLTLGRKFLTFYEASPDRLAIMEGLGPNRVVQQFDILAQQALEP